MRYSPDTQLTETIDGECFDKALAFLPADAPYREVLMAVRSDDDPSSPRTIEEYKDYILALTFKACGALHEGVDVCNYTAVNCPLKIKNAACLHGLDFRRFDEGRYLGVGENIWGLRVFALAYFLNELGYECPSFINNYEFWQKLHRKYDKLAAEKAWDRAIVSGDFTSEAQIARAKIQVVQSRFGLYFMGKYIIPTRAAFIKFWNEKVDAEPI